MHYLILVFPIQISDVYSDLEYFKAGFRKCILLLVDPHKSEQLCSQVDKSLFILVNWFGLAKPLIISTALSSITLIEHTTVSKLL